MTVVSSACIIASCNREVIQDNGFGYLGISLEQDLETDVVTKAGGDELVFAIDVLNSSGQIVESRDDYRSTVENPIKLHLGRYDVVARSGHNLNAAFDNPYYEGRTAESVRIVPGRVKTVDLTCSLANTIVSAAFSDDFRQFPEYEISVTNGVGEKLVFSNNPENGKANEAAFGTLAYFAVTGTLTYEILIRNTDGGVWTQTATIPDVKAKQHYHLALSLGDSSVADGAVVIKISLNDEWVDGDHNINLDFSKKDAPVIETNAQFGAVSGEDIVIPLGDRTNRTFTFSAGYGMASLKMNHNNATLLECGIPRDFDFVGATSEQLSAINKAGISLDVTPSGDITMQTTKVVANCTNLFAALPLGSYEMEFVLKDTQDNSATFYLDFIVDQDDVEAVSAGTGWTAFAQLNAKLNNPDKKSSATFQYKKSSAGSWIEVDKSKIQFNTSNTTFSTLVFGLEPSTEYVFRAVSDEDKETRTVKFRTEAYHTLHNMSFDTWTKSNKFPNADGYAVWDSANSTNLLTTTTPVDDAVSGKAAMLKSMYKFMFAAGNLFTGDFLKAVVGANVGATLDWGTPFTGRPLALRGYYKYSPKTVTDYTTSKYSFMKNQTDQCQILVCLTDWDKPFTVNTAEDKFVDFDNDKGIIAYGVFNTSEASSEYIQFTIPLVYRSNTRIPTYVIIAGASSRYGDYFTGAVDSTLWLDEFEFVYDPAELTEEEFNAVFSRVKPF